MNLIKSFLGFLKSERKQENEESESSDPSGEEKLKSNSYGLHEIESLIVREIITPRTDMVCLDINSFQDVIEEVLFEWKHSRIPVYEERIENVLGILNLKDLAKFFIKNNDISKESLKKILKEPYIVPNTKKITELLQKLIEKKIELCLVVDEYGGILGIVTQKDIYFEIMRNIKLISDNSLFLDKNGSVLVAANTDIDKVEEFFQVSIPHKDFDTVCGLIFNLTGRIPVEGECFQYKSLTFQVAKAKEHKLQQIFIKKIKNEVVMNK